MLHSQKYGETGAAKRVSGLIRRRVVNAFTCRSRLAGTLQFRLREGPGFHGKTSMRSVPTLCSSPCRKYTSYLRSTHLNTALLTRGTGAAASNSRGTAAGGNQILTAIIMNTPTSLMCRALVEAVNAVRHRLRASFQIPLSDTQNLTC